ncbi:MFS transporter [Peribacillus asahii]|uniref:MFS transporter n=1 Tax=Peribacillus asahii TaxID=228899 RepID=UPI003828A535
MDQLKPRLWTAQYFLVVFMTFLFFLCLHMMNAGFPIFVTGVSKNPAIGGTTMTAFMIAAIITRPFVSFLLQKIEIKKTIAITLCIIFICVFLSYGQTSIPFLLCIRVMEGIGFGLVTTLLATLVTSHIPSERIGEGIGYFSMATSLGASLAPVVALSMIHSFSFNSLLLLAIAIIISILGCSMFIKRIHSNHQHKNQGTIMDYVFDKKVLLPSILVLFLCVTFGGVFNFIDGLGKENGMGSQITLFFVIFVILMLVVRPISGKIFDRKGHKGLIVTGSVSGIIGLILLTITNNLFMLVTAAVFYSICYGTIQPTLQSWAVSRVSPEKKATANAMVLNGMDLGMAIGAPTLGLIAGHTSYKFMFGSSSICILLLLVIYLFIMSRSRNKKLKLTVDHRSHQENTDLKQIRKSK